MKAEMLIRVTCKNSDDELDYEKHIIIVKAPVLYEFE